MVERVESRENKESSYRSFKGWSIAIGILMMLLGVVTITLATATTFMTVLLLGSVVLVRGVFEVIHAVQTHGQEGFWARLFEGILAVVIGLFLLLRPGISALGITLFIAALLVVGGLVRAIAAPIEHPKGWGWAMFGGIVSFALGVWLWSGWPVTAIWFIGLLVGVEILATGITLTALPFAVEPMLGPPHAAERR
jgi:uncharacterized membrane protein HdeD (DUF308 family)